MDPTNFYDYVVNPESFTLMLDKPWYILFFSPNCPHCVHFKPTWNEFHNLHKSEINVGSVDCKNAGRPLCTLYGIRSYPTINYFPVDGAELSTFYTFNGHDRLLSTLEEFSL